MIRMGSYGDSSMKLPLVLGFEGSGVVCEVGTGVDQFKVGSCTYKSVYVQFKFNILDSNICLMDWNKYKCHINVNILQETHPTY